jgi:hypothetical protein
MASDFVQVTLPTDNIVFHEGRGQYIVKCATIPSDYSGVQFTSAVSGIVTGVHSWYQGELQWYVNAKGQLCSADGTFRLGRNGVVIKSKSSELRNYGDEFGGIVEGSSLTDGSVIAKKLSDSSKLATTNCVFSSPDYNHVEWTAGVLVLGDGTSFSIEAGNTGVLTGMTYIYFDRAISKTQFQLAYAMTDIAYDGAILVCDAKQATSSDLLAHFVSINGYMLLNVNQLNVNYLSALSSNIGTIDTGLIRMGQATSFTTGAGVWIYGAGTASQLRVGDPATYKTISFDSGTGEVAFGAGVSFNWSQVAGTGKPANYATVGATWGSNLYSVPIRFAETPSGAGLYICPSYMGYYNGGAWTAYIDSAGLFACQSVSGGNTTILSSTGTYAIVTGPTGSPTFTLTHAGGLVTKLLTMYSSGDEIGLKLDSEGIDLWDSQGHVYLKAVNSTLRIKGGANNDTPFEVFYGTAKIFGVGYDTVEANFIEAPQIRSSVAIGKAPFKVNSTTVVSNLNADRVDGQHGPFAAQSHGHDYSPLGHDHYNENLNPNNVEALGWISADDYIDTYLYKVQGSSGASGSFTSADSKTVTVLGGIITNIT